MMRFKSPHGVVLLTEERKYHILKFHPDVGSYFRYFAAALAEPEHEVRSIHDSSVVICYRYIKHRRKYLAIVVKIGSHPFVLTAYLAKKPKRDTL